MFDTTSIRAALQHRLDCAFMRLIPDNPVLASALSRAVGGAQPIEKLEEVVQEIEALALEVGPGGYLTPEVR